MISKSQGLFKFNKISIRHPKSVSLGFAATRKERDEAYSKDKGVTPDVRMFFPHPVHMHDNHTDWVQEMVVWDSELKNFVFRREYFGPPTNSKNISRTSLSSAEIPMPDKTLTRDGVYVDQTKGRLYLPQGGWIDGPTGELYTAQGVSVSQLADQERCEKEV